MGESGAWVPDGDKDPRWLVIVCVFSIQEVFVLKCGLLYSEYRRGGVCG